MTIFPEDFGAVGDGVTDDNEAFRDMFASVTDGTCVQLRHGATYLIAPTPTMGPDGQTLALAGIKDFRLTGGGWLKRGASAVNAPTLLFFDDCENIQVDGMNLDGNRANLPAANVADTIQFFNCPTATVQNVISINSARHGVNASGCTSLRWGNIYTYNTKRYGFSHDDCREVVGSGGIFIEASERAGIEFTNGCERVAVSDVVITRCLDGILWGEHLAPDQTNRRISLTNVIVNGEGVTGRGLVFQGSEANFNDDVTVSNLQVHDVTDRAIAAEKVRRLRVSNYILRNDGTPDRRGIFTSDCEHVSFAHGQIDGFGPPVEFRNTEIVYLADTEIATAPTTGVVAGCGRVVLRGVTHAGCTPTDYLMIFKGEVDVSSITAERRQGQLVSVQEGAGWNNTKHGYRFIYATNWTVTVVSPGASAGAPVIPVSPLDGYLPAGATLTFSGGVTAKLTESALAGADEISVQPLSGPVASGETATYRTTLRKLIWKDNERSATATATEPASGISLDVHTPGTPPVDPIQLYKTDLENWLLMPSTGSTVNLGRGENWETNSAAVRSLTDFIGLEHGAKKLFRASDNNTTLVHNGDKCRLKHNVNRTMTQGEIVPFVCYVSGSVQRLEEVGYLHPV